MTTEQRVERIEYIYLRMQQTRNNHEQQEAYAMRLGRHKQKLIAAIAAKEAYGTTN
jgi:hypothetical protein